MKDQVLSQAEIDALFAQADSKPAAEKSGSSPAKAAPPPIRESKSVKPAPIPAPAMPTPAASLSAAQMPIDLLADVELDVTVQLGQTTRSIKEILEMGPGHVLELDRLAGDTVDILVNGRLVAKAEVVVIGDNFGVRITELIRLEGGNG